MVVNASLGQRDDSFQRLDGIAMDAKVERDQVEDYSVRKGMDIREVERWLSPILNYEPSAYAEAAE